MPRGSRSRELGRHESDHRRRRSESRSRSPSSRSKRRDDDSTRRRRRSRNDSGENRRRPRDASPARDHSRSKREEPPPRNSSPSRNKADRSPAERSATPEERTSRPRKEKLRKRRDSSSSDEPRRRHDSSDEEQQARSRHGSSSSPAKSAEVKHEPRSPSHSEEEHVGEVEQKPVVDGLSFSPVHMPEMEEDRRDKRQNRSPRRRRSSRDEERREHGSSRREEGTLVLLDNCYVDEFLVNVCLAVFLKTHAGHVAARATSHVKRNPEMTNETKREKKIERGRNGRRHATVTHHHPARKQTSRFTTTWSTKTSGNPTARTRKSPNGDSRAR